MERRGFDLPGWRGGRWPQGLAMALLIAAFGAGGLAAQTGTVTGLVRDAATQSPLAGAQVSIVGTGLGGLANNVGRFLILDVPAGQHVVRVQIIGYRAQERTVTVPAGGSAAVTFEMREEAIALEGVVVTGTAGQARRREIGNTISQISADDIKLAAVTDIADVLQGRAVGVQVNDHSGQVGAASQIRLRGNNSLTQGNDPLIYVDGIRIENNPIGSDDEQAQTPSALDMINSADIERVEVIKGPAATTLYGTEASGGVIQIFTKRGAAGAPAWTFSTEQGVSVMGHQGPDKSVNPNGLNLNNCSHEPGCPDNGSWFRNAHHQVYNLSVRGGGETATYFVSGRWADRQGVVDPQGVDEYTIRANINFTPLDGLDIRLNNHYARRNITWIPDGNNASGLLLNVLRGDAGYTPGNDDSLVLENDLFSHIDQYITGLTVNWQPNNAFSHRFAAGIDYTSMDYIDFKRWGFYEEPTGDREIDQQFDRNLTLDYVGTLNWSPFGEDITSRLSWGGQVYEEFSYALNGFDDTFAGPGEVVLGNGNKPQVFEDRITTRSGGFFVQEVLGWQDKLFLTGGVRWDGFSTFGSGFGLAAYPKVSASYLISDETFMPDFVETLKLRAAWGQSGKAPGAFDAARTFEAVSADEQVPAVIIANLGNPDLGPELSEELEWGFDASFYEGRVTLEWTNYDQTTKDALIGVQEAPSFGTEEATLRNLGEVKNWGHELLLDVVPVRTDDIEWSVGFTWSANDSEITDLGPLKDLGSSRQVGLPLWIRWDDIIQNPNELGVRPRYQKGMIGRLFPTDTYGISTRINLWRSLTLDLLGEGQYGMVRPIGVAYQNVRRRQWPGDDCPNIQRIYDEYKGPGEPPNLTALQIATCIGNRSDQGVWTDPADFFKLRSATLAYRLPEGWIPRAQSATISLQAKNMYTWTDYRGLDPEANDNGFGDSTPNEYYNLAPPRIFMINFTLNF